MKAVGYFVEGARRAGVKRSIGDQNRTFLEFCMREGYEVAATFIDTEADGAEGGGLPQMLNFLQRPERGFMVVVVDSLGVLGKDLGYAAMRLLTIENAWACRCSPRTPAGEAARELVTTWADRGDGTPVSEKVRRRDAPQGSQRRGPRVGRRMATASGPAIGSTSSRRKPSSSATSSACTSRRIWAFARLPGSSTMKTSSHAAVAAGAWSRCVTSSGTARTWAPTPASA